MMKGQGGYDESLEGYDESSYPYDERVKGYDETILPYDESCLGYDESEILDFGVRSVQNGQVWRKKMLFRVSSEIALRIC